MSEDRDDRLTVAAVSLLASILQDVVHEGLGHGLTAWLGGARHAVLSTVALQSDIATRWISANGTLANLGFAGVFWLALRLRRPARPAAVYFLVMALAGNLFTGTGYFLFSGVTDFGDWADVIRGLEPHGLWRLALILAGAASYFASMRLVAQELKYFHAKDSGPARIRVLSWTPYFADGVLAAAAGALNPAGLFYVVASALPSTLGANAGLLSFPGLVRPWRLSVDHPIGPIRRSRAAIAAGAGVSLLYIVILGRGVTLAR